MAGRSQSHGPRLSANVTGLVGFKANTDQAHIDAIRSINDRLARKKQLRWQVPSYVFGGEQFAERTRTAIRNFKNALPYRYEEERNNIAAREHYLAQALEYEEMADAKNYEAHRVSEIPTPSGSLMLARRHRHLSIKRRLNRGS